MANQSKSFDVVVIGSLNADLVVSTPRFPISGETITGSSMNIHCGGKGANQAYAAACAKASVAMVGHIGNDPFGPDLKLNLQNQGVDTSCIKTLPHLTTGMALIEVAPSGENRIVIIPGANGTYMPEHIHESTPMIQKATCVLLQMEISPKTNAHVIEKIKRSPEKVLILDPAPATPISKTWLKQIDYITPNQTELNVLTEQTLPEDASMDEFIFASRLLCQQGAKCIVVKLGARGALMVTQTDSYHSPAPKITAVDTTAAGDCFNGVFAAGIASGLPIHSAIDQAVKAASISVTRHGAQASMPKAAELHG